MFGAEREQIIVNASEFARHVCFQPLHDQFVHFLDRFLSQDRAAHLAVIDHAPRVNSAESKLALSKHLSQAGSRLPESGTLYRAKSGVVRSQVCGIAHRVPLGRDRVELLAHQRPKETPQARIAHDGVCRQPRKFLPEREPVHKVSRWMRTSRPSLIPSIAAALPPLIAIDTFRYASSYKIMSPGRASANVRAATA